MITPMDLGGEVRTTTDTQTVEYLCNGGWRLVCIGNVYYSPVVALTICEAP